MKKRSVITFVTVVVVVLCVIALVYQPQPAKGSVDSNTGLVTGKGQAKYVFLFIGDGMAMPQITSAEVFATARSSKDINVTRLGFSRFPVIGLATTYDAGTFITDRRRRERRLPAATRH